MRNFQIGLLSLFFCWSGLAATPGLIEIGNSSQSSLSPTRSHEMAYIEFERAAALMEFFGKALEAVGYEAEIDSLSLDQLYRQIQEPLQNASYLAIGDKDLRELIVYWQKKIDTHLRPRSLLDRRIASAANRFITDHEEMTVRLVPIRKKPKYKRMRLEMNLIAAKAIAASTLKLVNSRSMHRLFSYNSDTHFVYEHNQPKLLQIQNLENKMALTQVMLRQVSLHIAKALDEKQAEPIRRRAVKLIQNNHKQLGRFKKLPVGKTEKIRDEQTKIAAETEFEIKQMLYSVAQKGSLQK